MATGASAFQGDSPGLIFDAILNRGPTRGATEPELPQELDRVIAKCLEKDRELRYQHASEIRADLQRLKRDRDSGRVIGDNAGGTPGAAGRGKRWMLVAASSPLPPWSAGRSTVAVPRS